MRRQSVLGLHLSGECAALLHLLSGQRLLQCHRRSSWSTGAPPDTRRRRETPAAADGDAAGAAAAAANAAE